MTRELLKRAGLAAASIFGASILAFVVLRILPGDPARQALGAFATDDQLAQFREVNNLNEPYPVQYLTFIKNFVTGDWGFSYSAGVPVRTLFGQAFPATIELAMTAFLVAVLGATALALLASYSRRRWVDRVINTAAYVGLGAPAFWTGLVLILVFTQALGWAPTGGGRIDLGHTIDDRTGFILVDTLLDKDLAAFRSAVGHMILPVLTLSFAVWAYLVRILRVSLLEVQRMPFVLAGEAKGVSRWSVHVRHVLHNAMLPTLAASGLSLGTLLGGSVLVESVFDWPGVGDLVTQSISQKDFSTFDVFVILTAVTFVVINLVVDAMSVVLDPRISHKERR